jgi:hypothetical protein
MAQEGRGEETAAQASPKRAKLSLDKRGIIYNYNRDILGSKICVPVALATCQHGNWQVV